MQHCFTKHGEESFEFSILEEVSDKTHLVSREQYYLDARAPWMNILTKAGSLLGHRWTDAQKANASKSQKIASITRIPKNKGKTGEISDETRAAIKAGRAKQVMKTGHTLTDEHRRNIALARIGKPVWSTGKKFTDEHKQKLAAAKLGKKQPPRSEEWRKKISEHKKAYWAKRKLDDAATAI